MFLRSPGSRTFSSVWTLVFSSLLKLILVGVYFSSHSGHLCRCVPAGSPRLRHLLHSAHLQLMPMITTTHTLQYFSSVWRSTHFQFVILALLAPVDASPDFQLFCLVFLLRFSQNVPHSNHTGTASRGCFSVLGVCFAPLLLLLLTFWIPDPLL